MKDLKSLDAYRLKDEERKLRFGGILGDDNNGVFKVRVNGHSLFVIASDGGG